MQSNEGTEGSKCVCVRENVRWIERDQSSGEEREEEPAIWLSISGERI